LKYQKIHSIQIHQLIFLGFLPIKKNI